jgi:hypothetical protein
VALLEILGNRSRDKLYILKGKFVGVIARQPEVPNLIFAIMK